MTSIRRQAIGGLAGIIGSVAGVIFATSTPIVRPVYSTPYQQNSAVQDPQEQTYKIVVQINDNWDVSLENFLLDGGSTEGNKIINGFDPRTLAIEGAPEYVRRVAQKFLKFKEMPDISHPQDALENLAQELYSNPNYLSLNFKLGGVSAEESGVIHQLGYNRRKENYDGNETTLDFRAFKREDGSLEVIRLTEYGSSVSTADHTYRATVAGGLDFEVMYGGVNDNNTNRKEVHVKPAYKNDRRTLSEVDLFGHRKRLLEGLRKQNLRFTPDWKPVTQK